MWPFSPVHLLLSDTSPSLSASVSPLLSTGYPGPRKIHTANSLPARLRDPQNTREKFKLCVFCLTPFSFQPEVQWREQPSSSLVSTSSAGFTPTTPSHPSALGTASCPDQSRRVQLLCAQPQQKDPPLPHCELSDFGSSPNQETSRHCSYGEKKLRRKKERWVSPKLCKFWGFYSTLAQCAVYWKSSVHKQIYCFPFWCLQSQSPNGAGSDLLLSCNRYREVTSPPHTEHSFNTQLDYFIFSLNT